jgi:hypothetical protein
MLLNKWVLILVCLTGVSIVTGSALARAAELPTAMKGVIVTTPGLVAADARAYALKQDKLLLSDYLEISRPGDENDQMIRQKLERAQRAWLGGDIETARTEFRSLTELSLKADWRTTQREVLQMAFLRLAQSSESGTEREGWLESAARLYTDISPKASLFPPPLLNEYEATRKRLAESAIEIDLRDVFPDFRYVLIDGRKVVVALETRVRITSGLHRMTALSDSHEAVTEFLTGAQMRVLKLSPPALTEGRCESAAFRSRTEFPSAVSVEIYSGSGCSAKIADLLGPSRFISGAHSASSASSLGSSVGESEFSGLPQAASHDHTWIWVVGAAVLAGAGYALASHHDSSPEPTHKSGF